MVSLHCSIQWNTRRVNAMCRHGTGLFHGALGGQEGVGRVGGVLGDFLCGVVLVVVVIVVFFFFATLRVIGGTRVALQGGGRLSAATGLLMRLSRCRSRAASWSTGCACVHHLSQTVCRPRADDTSSRK